MKVELGKAWTTHIGVLVKVLLISEGDVVELGAGPNSTPLLHWLCKDLNRRLISYENDPDYYSYARQFRSGLHKVVFVKNWDDINPKTHCGLLFVDHGPTERRAIDILRLKDCADYIVIHDTEAENYYLQVWPQFKHKYTWKESRPWVSVVSNFKDLSGLE